MVDFRCFAHHVYAATSGQRIELSSLDHSDLPHVDLWTFLAVSCATSSGRVATDCIDRLLASSWQSFARQTAEGLCVLVRY